MKTIFVYGSLRKGEYNHHLIKDTKQYEFLGPAIIKGYTLYDSGGDYPMAVHKEGAHIEGEIYEISEECFIRILRMEINASYSLDCLTNILKNKVIILFWVPTKLVEDYRLKEVGPIWKSQRKEVQRR